jgi:oxalate decarboxylase/phosphoglucose isomerase-like protein (cupin superfamily)
MQTIWLECTQEAGEIIFVPSGWYHQVHNLVSSGSDIDCRYIYALFSKAFLQATPLYRRKYFDVPNIILIVPRNLI